MAIWSAEIKELERLYESLKGKLPGLEKEMEQLIRTEDANVVMLYSRRCLEVIITDLCECELKRPRKTEPLHGIIDKLHKEEKVPSHIIASMHGLNELSTYGAHPKDFDPEQVKPVLNNLDIIIKWYLKYKETGFDIKVKPAEEIRQEIKSTGDVKKDIAISRKRLAGTLGGSIGVIASIFAVLYFSNIIGGGKQSKEIEKSIAVLPFKLLSDEPDKQYLADGMMDAITLHLSKIKDLRVMSRTSVEQFRNPTKTTNAIGRELNVEYLLEGSFQKFGDNVRLIVQLIKTGKEGHVWANNYDRNWNSVFSVQSEVAQAIAKELYASITQDEKVMIEKVPTSNMTAYDLYLKANGYQKDYQKTRNQSSYQTAINLYRAALQIDSAFAKSYTGLAKAYWDRYYYETFFKENFLDSCLVLVNTALSLDDRLEEAYYLKGMYYYEKGNFKEALNNFDKTIKINQNYPDAYNQKGWIHLAVLGNLIAGLENYHKALNLTSGKERAAVLRTLGGIYGDRGFIEKARSMFNEALTLDGDSASNRIRVGYLESALGNLDVPLKFIKKYNERDSTFTSGLDIYNAVGPKEEAYIYAERIIKIYKRRGTLPLHDSHRIAYAFWQVGKYKEAKYYLNQQIKYGEESLRLSRDFTTAVKYDLAGAYAFSGEKEKAYKLLEEFSTKKDFTLWWLSMMRFDTLFESIRSEERFKKIVQNMEAKYQASHELIAKWLEDQGMLN